MKYIEFKDSWIVQRKKGESSFYIFFNNIFNIFFGRKADKNKIKVWYLEIYENGSISREIGLDENKKVIVKAPFMNDYGLWTDSNVSINYKDYKAISIHEFNELWASYPAV